MIILISVSLSALIVYYFLVRQRTAARAKVRQ